MLRRSWIVVTVAAVVLLIGSGVCLLQFVAAADLGYDARADGRAIITFWSNAWLGLLAGSVACCVLAVVLKRRQRRG
jgi:hypothetical protein